MAANSTGIDGIMQIGISVSNLEKSTAFYRDTLGLAHLFTANGMAFFDCGGLRLLVGLRDKNQKDRVGSIIYFRSDDIERTAAMLADRGVAFTQQPHLVARLPGKDVWLAEFADPDRNPLALMSEVSTGS